MSTAKFDMVEAPGMGPLLLDGEMVVTAEAVGVRRGKTSPLAMVSHAAAHIWSLCSLLSVLVFMQGTEILDKIKKSARENKVVQLRTGEIVLSVLHLALVVAFLLAAFYIAHISREGRKLSVDVHGTCVLPRHAMDGGCDLVHCAFPLLQTMVSTQPADAVSIPHINSEGRDFIVDASGPSHGRISSVHNASCSHIVHKNMSFVTENNCAMHAGSRSVILSTTNSQLVFMSSTDAEFEDTLDSSHTHLPSTDASLTGSISAG